MFSVQVKEIKAACDALLLMADAGLCEWEVRSLKWSDATDASITVRGKGKRARIVPIARRRLPARSFRYGLAVRAMRRIVSVTALQQVLGHSSLATTHRYLQSLEGDQEFVRRALARF